MIEDTQEPLWRAIVGDTEAWRKGRLFLIAFAILNLVTDAVALTELVLSALPVFLTIYVAYRLLFWLQFYCIWIGVHWVRWFLGGLLVIFGFCQFIWSFDSGSGLMGSVGVFYIVTGIFLAVAPPVYQFAVRQKENRNWPEMIGTAVVGAILFTGLTAGVLALLRFQELYRRDAARFADLAFDSIYRHQDEDFLVRHASARAWTLPNAQQQMASFAMNALANGGSADDIEPANGLMLLRYRFPFTVWSTGNIRAQGSGPYGAIIFQVQIVGQPGSWEIDSIGWYYPARARSPGN